MSTVSEAMKELIRQQLLTLHTCLICKVLRVYSDGTAKVHPLTMVQTRSGEVHQHQVLDGVPIADQVKSTIRVGCVCVVVFAERDIAKALTGDYALPSLARHHSLSDGLIVGTIGETPGETIPGTQWYAPLSAETSTAKTTVKDSKTDAGKEIYVDVKCDPAEDNLLYATSDGLYAPGYTKAEIDSKINQKSHVTVFPHQTTGTKIATITVDEITYDVYAPQVPSQEQIDAWTYAAEQAHTHANKDVLDEITAAYTTEEQEKLSGIEDGANKYVHPTHTAHATGFYKIANDAQGHLTAAESVTKSDITELGVPGNNTTYTLTSDINTSSYHKIILTGSDGTKNAVNVDNVVQDKIPHSSVGTDLEYCLTASRKINGNGGRRVGSVYVAQELVYGIKNKVPYVRISPGSQKGVSAGAAKLGFVSSEIGGFVNDVGFYGGIESTNPYLYALNGIGLNTFFKAKNSSSTSYETSSIFTIFGQNTKYYEKIFGNSEPLYDGEITVESPIALASMTAKYKHENAEGYEYKNSNIENINITFYGYTDSDVIYTFGRNGTFSAPKLSSANATQSEQGLMSAADKAKLDEIEIGANKITVDTALSATSTNPVQNKAIKAALDGKAASNHTHAQYYNTTISRTANTVLAAPNGSAGSATFRKLVASDIPDLSGKYLPLSGGTLTKSSFGALTIARSGSAYGASIGFSNSNGTLGYIGMGNGVNSGLKRWSADTKTVYTVLDTGNYSDYALPADGNAASATKLTTSAGSATRPVYFSDGKPVAGTYTLGAACAKGVTDSSSASAIGTGTSLPTERDIYYGLPTINGSHSYTSSTNIYAPTSVGTSGYVLKSNGSGAPSWTNGRGIAIGQSGKGTGSEIFNVYGNVNEAAGNYSHSEGYSTSAGGDFSHAEGADTTASGDRSHAEGYNTTASGARSHAGGWGCEATGEQSRAWGYFCQATSNEATAMGANCVAYGKQSLAGGNGATATGQGSLSFGNSTTTAGSYQVAFGQYNVTNQSATTYKLVVGNGTGTGARANCFRVAATGVYAAGSYASSGADYAEYFEWEDGNPDGEDRRGLLVTYGNGEKIRIASPGDDILGIVSGNASVIGDAYEDQWQGQYLCDIYGSLIQKEQEDEEGNLVTNWELNPEYDSTQTYIPRSQRPEWAPIGMLGKLVVRDDGTCTVNGYCTVGAGGIATKSDTGWRVIARADDNHVKIVYR